MPERFTPNGAYLVTGAGGFLGGSTLEKLRLEGCGVMGTTRKIDSELKAQMGLVELDSSNPEQVNRAVFDLRPKVIFHFAGIAAPVEVTKNQKLGKEINVDSTLYLVDAVINTRKKFNDFDPVLVVAGSVEQIGESKVNGEILVESSERNPLNIYGEQKELMAKVFLGKCRKFGIRGYVMIQGQASGVSESGLISQDRGFFIPDIASQVAELEAAGAREGMIETGITTQQRNIIDVRSAVLGYLALAKKKPPIGEYLICADRSYPLDQYLDLILKFSSVNIERKIDLSRGSGSADRFYSAQKLKSETSWSDQTKIEDMMRRVLEFQRNKVR